MMANPKLGQRVQIWYAKRYAHTMPLHGKFGTVVVVSKGKPRNHGVAVDGVMYAIPCGNLNKVLTLACSKKDATDQIDRPQCEPPAAQLVTI